MDLAVFEIANNVFVHIVCWLCTDETLAIHGAAAEGHFIVPPVILANFGRRIRVGNVYDVRVYKIQSTHLSIGGYRELFTFESIVVPGGGIESEFNFYFLVVRFHATIHDMSFVEIALLIGILENEEIIHQRF